MEKTAAADDMTSTQTISLRIVILLGASWTSHGKTTTPSILTDHIYHYGLVILFMRSAKLKPTSAEDPHISLLQKMSCQKDMKGVKE